MIRRAHAVRFDRIAESGRNKPLLVGVETEDGVLHEAFLKISGRPEIGFEGLANEALAACLAGRLGLPICEPLLVEIEPAWCEMLADSELRAVVQASCPIGFGSASARPGWRIWSAADRLLRPRLATALAIFIFDAFIENQDRRAQTPNLLVKGDAFRIIDHELAFRIRQKLFPRPEPWTLGYLDRAVNAEGHIFGHLLKAANGLDFAPVVEAWSGLSDADLADCATALPPEWAPAVGAVDDALSHLRSVRERLDECMIEVERALA